MHNSLNGKYRHPELAPWSARHYPFGEGHGHTCTVLRPVQGSEHGLQILANEELQMQILHTTRESEVRPRHQTRTRDRPPNVTRHSMLVHTADQEPFDANKHNALLKATQESYHSMLALHCLQSWEASQITVGYGPVPPTEEKQEENVTKSSEQEDPPT